MIDTYCRLNVLVEVEGVAWIVHVLQGDQALVVDAVGSPYLRFPFIAQEVRIDSFHREWEECCLYSALPFRLPLSLMLVVSTPPGRDLPDVRHLAEGHRSRGPTGTP